MNGLDSPSDIYGLLVHISQSHLNAFNTLEMRIHSFKEIFKKSFSLILLPPFAQKRAQIMQNFWYKLETFSSISKVVMRGNLENNQHITYAQMSK